MWRRRKPAIVPAAEENFTQSWYSWTRPRWPFFSLATAASCSPDAACGSGMHHPKTGSWPKTICAFIFFYFFFKAVVCLLVIVLPMIIYLIWGYKLVWMRTCLWCADTGLVKMENQPTCDPCASAADSPDMWAGHTSRKTASAAPACGRHKTQASAWTHLMLLGYVHGGRGG